jgi:hypothetical protein
MQPRHTSEVKRVNGWVEHTISAIIWEDMIAEVSRVMAQYHPLGYGTHVSSIRFDVNARWVAVVRRSGSCD